MKTQSLKLTDIVTTAGTQIRAKIDAEAVSDYADAMTDGAKFPAVVVFHDGSEYILADGFHRVMAAARNGFRDILADIHKGTKRDALKFALGANSAHGIKRTNADKRRSVELALAEWAKLSNSETAKLCAVSDDLVATVRSDMESNLRLAKVDSRVGADGKTRKVPTPKLTPAPLVDVEEEPHITQPSIDAQWKAAAPGVVVPDAPLENPMLWYNKLKAFVEQSFTEASDKQLDSMSVFAATVPKLIKAEKINRKQNNPSR